MKISPNANERLVKVPLEKRVFLYDASIIIEFLNSTFMPLSYHLTKEAMQKIGAGSEIKKSDFNQPERYAELFISMYQLYEYYKMFRNHRPYTSTFETKYKFSIIIKRILLPKNGWQFEVKRVGRAQLIYVGPVELRGKVNPEVLKNYPIPEPKVSEVKVGLSDLQDSTNKETDEPKLPDEQVIDPTLT